VLTRRSSPKPRPGGRPSHRICRAHLSVRHHQHPRLQRPQPMPTPCLWPGRTRTTTPPVPATANASPAAAPCSPAIGARSARTMSTTPSAPNTATVPRQAPWPIGVNQVGRLGELIAPRLSPDDNLTGCSPLLYGCFGCWLPLRRLACARRWLSPLISMMWQWCTSRSTAATVIELLGKISSQAVNGWLAVISTERRS
jgi:hypothetical protein